MSDQLFADRGTTRIARHIQAENEKRLAAAAKWQRAATVARSHSSVRRAASLPIPQFSGAQTGQAGSSPYVGRAASLPRVVGPTATAIGADPKQPGSGVNLSATPDVGLRTPHALGKPVAVRGNSAVPRAAVDTPRPVSTARARSRSPKSVPFTQQEDRGKAAGTPVVHDLNRSAHCRNGTGLGEQEPRGLSPRTSVSLLTLSASSRSTSGGINPPARGTIAQGHSTAAHSALADAASAAHAAVADMNQAAQEVIVGIRQLIEAHQRDWSALADEVRRSAARTRYGSDIG